MAGEWCARDPTRFAPAESFCETWGCYSLTPTSVALLRCVYAFAVPTGATCKMLRTFRRLTRRASRGWTSLARTIPTSDVPCRLRAPPCGSSPQSQLIARSVTGRATFTRKPEPPSEHPVRSAHSYDPERLPSYAALARLHVRSESVAASGKRLPRGTCTPIRPRLCRRARSTPRRPPSG